MLEGDGVTPNLHTATHLEVGEKLSTQNDQKSPRADFNRINRKRKSNEDEITPAPDQIYTKKVKRIRRSSEVNPGSKTQASGSISNLLGLPLGAGTIEGHDNVNRSSGICKNHKPTSLELEQGTETGFQKDSVRNNTWQDLRSTDPHGTITGNESNRNFDNLLLSLHTDETGNIVLREGYPMNQITGTNTRQLPDAPNRNFESVFDRTTSAPVPSVATATPLGQFSFEPITADLSRDRQEIEQQRFLASLLSNNETLDHTTLRNRSYQPSVRFTGSNDECNCGVAGHDQTAHSLLQIAIEGEPAAHNEAQLSTGQELLNTNNDFGGTDGGTYNYDLDSILPKPQE